MEALETAKRKRIAAKGWLTRVSKQLNDVLATETFSEVELNELIVDCEERLRNLDEAQSQVEELIEIEELEQDIETAAIFRSEKKTILTKGKNCFRNIRSRESIADDGRYSQAESVREERANGSTCAKLPKLSLPSFSGDFAEWQSFWDNFVAIIDSRTDLSTINKFSYLQSSLKGDAKACLLGLALTEANYCQAKELLENRFGRKEKIITSHIQKLLNISQKNKNDLWTLYDEIQVHVRSLASLDVNGSNYGLVLVPLILHQLPPGLRLQWARQSDNREGDLEFLLKFLYDEIQHRERSRIFESCITKESSKKPQIQPTASALLNPDHRKSSSPRCVFCNSSHYPDKCPDIAMLTHEQRVQKIKSLRLCFRCLSRVHFAEACNKRCYHCKGPHHSVLHIRKPPVENQPLSNRGFAACQADVSLNSGPVDQTSTLYTTDHSRNKNTLMQCVKTSLNGWNVYVLFDTGSDRSYITNTCAKRLKLTCIGEEVLSFSGFAAQQGQKRCLVYEMNVKNERMKLYGIDTICQPMFRSKVPCEILEKLQVPIFERLERDSLIKVDILVGLDSYWSMIDDLKHVNEGLVAQCTKFGWMISGCYKRNRDIVADNDKSNAALFCLAQEPTEATIRSFWELDSIGIQGENASGLIEDSTVFNEFSKGVSLVNNRYRVGLPWKSMEHKEMLVNNEQIAQKRLNSLNKRLETNPNLKQRYNEVFSDLEKQGIIEEILPEETSNPVFYLPHRPVVREDSLSTKVRPVFDASVKGPNNVSLNDCVEVGPKLVPDLVQILLRFRRWKFALTADIQKAFLQIELNESDRDVHRFLLGESPDRVRHMRFNRVTFGNAASPFILNAVIKLHISKFEESKAVNELRNNLYIDDLLSGSDSEKDIIDLKQETDRVMREGSFTLTKWSSNCPRLFLAKDKTLNDCTYGMGTKKVLGVGWDSHADCFHFEFLKEVKSILFSKRALLGMIAQIFDPLGFLNPFTISIKILFQETWRLGLEWDAILPEVMQQDIEFWISGLEVISQWKIDRRLSCQLWTDLHCVELLVFVDASTKAYGCCVYLKSGQGESLDVNLVMSKVRVAPLTEVTLPRLELLAALLGARLLEYTRKALELPTDVKYTCFSDSQITLGWIKGNCSRWKQFVRNRVSEIQTLTDPAHWKHCAGVDNPADLLTRGVSANLMTSNYVWLKGPKWLMQPDAKLLTCDEVDSDSVLDLPESEIEPVDTLCYIAPVETSLIDFERFSSFRKLLRVVNLVLRFIKKTRKLEHDVDDLLVARIVLFRLIQTCHYSEEIEMLKAGGVVKNGSSLKKLNPFMGEDGLLRVKGRLGHAPSLSYDEKHPAILPKCHVSLLLIRAQHLSLKHAGVNLLISSLRDRYWIVSIRPLSKRVVRHCVACQRQDSRLLDQSTAPLPENRVARSPPFSVIGLDNAGPLFCSDFPGQKFYILLFTCAVTRAIHLELIDSLSSDDFCLALKRFCSRRAIPAVVYADNAKTFKGAQKLLLDHFGYELIQWKTQPALAPWWGGFYERMVRSVKTGLRKSVGKGVLSKKHLENTLIEVEACINSRPLTQTSDNDTYLTPSHFLIGRGSPLNPPELLHLNELFDLPSLYECHTHMLNVFWKTWVKEYLRSLPPLSGKKSSSRLKEGCLVLVHDEHKKRMHWDLGKVIKVFKGLDGLVRAAKIKTKTTCLVRPIQRLVLLELDYNGESQTKEFVEKDDSPHPLGGSSLELDIRTPAETEIHGPAPKSNDSRQTRSGRSVKQREILDL